LEELGICSQQEATYTINNNKDKNPIRKKKKLLERKECLKKDVELAVYESQRFTAQIKNESTLRR
jgi:hypothetical protein